MDNKKIIGRLLRRMGPNVPGVILTLILAAIYVALSLYIPILVGRGIDCIIDTGKVDFAALKWELIRIALCAGGAALSQWLMNEINNRITYHMIRDLRNDAFAHLQKQPLAYLDSHPHGDVVSRIIGDVDTFADGLLMGLTQFFTGLLTIIGTLILLLIINWKIALVVILITPLSLVVAAVIAKSTHDMFVLQSKTRGEQTALMDEAIGQMKVLKAFGREEATLERFDEVNGRLKKASLRAIFYSSLTQPSTRFVNALVYAGVGLVGALIAIGGGISVGILSSLLNYANQYTKPFNEISGVVTELQNALSCIGRVFELMDAPSQTPDPEQPEQPEAVCGSVEIRNLDFSYNPEKPLIRDFNLNVMPGQRVAIVGPTGCGKTTLINLLMRFYDPQEGEIHLDGVDAANMARGQLRSSIGMVLQDTWLKAGTIRENIAMGKPDATEEEIVAAAKASHAHNFIKRLPKGYDTVIGESGGSLSQGQKQLLCIARVMLCLPPMLILDEATSSIDTRTEMRIQKAFGTMMEGRTSFIVAHRLSTIQEADVILVMRDGRIVEQGTHKSLLEANGFYASLYKSQFVQA